MHSDSLFRNSCAGPIDYMNQAGFTEELGDNMVYTRERLQRAVDVFCASKPYLKRKNLSSSYLASHLESKSRQYHTRSGNTSVAVRTTLTGIWDDQDESGEYTPRKKDAISKARKSAPNGVKRKRCESKRDGDKAKKSKASYTSGRQKGLALEVTFKFMSDTARARVAALFPNAIPDNDENGDNDDRTNGPNEAQMVIETACNSLPTASIYDAIVIDDSGDSEPEDSGRVDNPPSSNEATTKKFITTNWAHPIEYRCEPFACNFCRDFRYSIFGCGTVDIEVIQLTPGVYEEMGGGHRERGVPRTKICLNCVVERIAIAKCPGHEILHIEGCREEDFDYQSFFENVTASSNSESLTCSICISPAFYACATRQKEDPFGLPAGSEEDSCGLLLCEGCARLVSRCGLDMQKIRAHAGGRRLRADCDFLLPGSDLWQAWKAWLGGNKARQGIAAVRV